MLEQQLINAFMKLTAKVGAGHLVRDLIMAVDENGNPKQWSAAEMEKAIATINMQISDFDKHQAAEVIRTLVRKFHLSADDLKSLDEVHHEGEDAHVRGLQ